MKVLENPYCQIWHNPQENFLHVKWLDNSAWHAKESDYQVYFEKYVEVVEKYEVSNVMHDMRLATFTIPISLQTWTAEQMFPRLIVAGMKKLALIFSHDFIVSLSVEQVMEEGANAQELPFETQYFDDEDKASAWLIGKSLILED